MIDISSNVIKQAKVIADRTKTSLIPVRYSCSSVKGCSLAWTVSVFSLDEDEEFDLWFLSSSILTFILPSPACIVMVLFYLKGVEPPKIFSAIEKLYNVDRVGQIGLNNQQYQRERNAFWFRYPLLLRVIKTLLRYCGIQDADSAARFKQQFLFVQSSTGLNHPLQLLESVKSN